MKILKNIVKPFISRPVIAKRMTRTFLKMQNSLDRAINRLVCFTEDGIHPKHRLMKYHQFFIDHIQPHESVLDVGCGMGMVAFDLSKKAKWVVGIDLDKEKIEWAQKKYSRSNLSFVLGDARTTTFSEKFDVIVLSNILEHIEDRVSFLKKMVKLTPKILVRVPMINRDWSVLYKRELGLNYRLDDTHFIEYTHEELMDEFAQAGLKANSINVCFGEFWVVAEKITNNGQSPS